MYFHPRDQSVNRYQINVGVQNKTKKGRVGVCIKEYDDIIDDMTKLRKCITVTS